MSRLRDALYFSSIPPPGEVTIRNLAPFTLTLSSGTTGVHVIDLYSQFSRSRPALTTENKYGHLLPQWEFQDLSGNTIQSVTTDDRLVTSGGIVVGTAGTASFYYVDDMPTYQNSPVLLWATLQTSATQIDYDTTHVEPAGYSNSKVAAVYPYTVNATMPDHLNITRNGISDFTEPKWATVEFPYVITVNGSTIDCGFGAVDPIIFDYPQTNAIGASAIREINRTITSVSSHPVSGDVYTYFSSADQVWTPDSQFFQASSVNGLHIGGFVRGGVKSEISATNAMLSANTFITYSGYRETPYAWISNPENRTINRITYTKTLPTSYSSIITSFPLSLTAITMTIPEVISTPYITEIDTTNTWSYSGYGGIFGIAIDRCYNVWTSDSELDMLYKFSYDGTMLSSIDLSDTSLISGVSAGCTPAGIKLDSNNNVYVSLFDSVSVLQFNLSGDYVNYIAPNGYLDSLDNVGNPLYMPSTIEPDIDDNLWVAYSNSNNSDLIKFDPDTREILASASLPISSTPIDLIVDERNNNIWVTNAGSNVGLLGNVQLYSTAGVLISSYTGFAHPSYMTMDSNNTVWFTHGYHNVGFITTAGDTGSFTVSANDVSPDPVIPTWFGVSSIEDSALGGIAADSNNRIMIIK